MYLRPVAASRRHTLGRCADPPGGHLHALPECLKPIGPLGDVPETRLGQMDDSGFLDYQSRVEEKEREFEEADVSRAAGRYDWTPVPHRGLTVLAEPYPIAGEPADRLQALQAELSEIAGFAPVPAETLHMTIADLLSGEAYGMFIESGRSNEDVAERYASVIAPAPPDGPGASSVGFIAGLGLFPGASVVIAPVRIPKRLYESIIRMRAAIYGDAAFGEWGVQHTFPFMGHVTLGYLERVPPAGLARVIHRVRQAQELGITFEIRGARVYSFPHMSAFHPVGEPVGFPKDPSNDDV